MMKGNTADTVIIKKRRSRGHAARHGGAWKVAFADFTLAMMAFFMVMWVLQVTTEDEKQRIVGRLSGQQQLLAHDGLFVENSPFAVDFGGKALPGLQSQQPSNPQNLGNSLTINVVDGDGDNFGGLGEDGPSLVPGRYESHEQMVVLGEYLKDVSEFLSASNQLSVEVVPQGLRVLVNDDNEKPMFKLGGAELTPFFEDLLLAIAPTFATIENPIMISGHADASGFSRRSRGNNWALSGERAQKAREVLEYGGMPSERVAQVTAMSDTMLLDEDAPYSHLNRRIEILVLTSDTEEQLQQLFGRDNGESSLEAAKQAAYANQPVS
ncbi:OmpA family protein [Photobacterium sp. ZSDE20]|uniref:OmpA family protein n=1 Tax=Photobacterium pectinilyticum TaxID=2906793 RepID=A0ABT1N0Z3_9GAMM|nr:flagellar motor protein MotB [Photobacterium sp. ZSDE20]MCQ1057446.1 OmpA family protein [Photobacterium sp. ZSDE20]MDD1821605.1 OmpA family protein [Photobacterium sp. ZSDE20]